ncbi:hypothetical protein ACFFLM_17420 [Deinococcus oregonensis]|uniref:Uncharacterized protein n=1 Tax=Deinococcus oregonensis TaxID=1805970 RepID=A0ABV6B5L7_9DEIO
MINTINTETAEPARKRSCAANSAPVGEERRQSYSNVPRTLQASQPAGCCCTGHSSVSTKQHRSASSFNTRQAAKGLENTINLTEPVLQNNQAQREEIPKHHDLLEPSKS